MNVTGVQTCALPISCISADHDDARAFTREDLRGGVAGRAATDDDDTLLLRRALFRRLRCRCCGGAYDENAITFAFHFISRQWRECRRTQHFTAAQIETGVMPRAANRLTDAQAFRERAGVMRARRANGEELIADAREQHRFAIHVARNEPVARDFIDQNASSQISHTSTESDEPQT